MHKSNIEIELLEELISKQSFYCSGFTYHLLIKLSLTKSLTGSERMDDRTLLNLFKVMQSADVDSNSLRKSISHS